MEAKPSPDGHARPSTELSDLLTYRYRRNLTLVQLSELTGLSPSTLHRLERGILKPSPRSLVKLMDGLGLSADKVEHMIRLSAAKYGKPARSGRTHGLR
ncbi:MAG: helix-turn-helix transcriptional regulator [Planctomycetota bacterium]|nr:helix-turn-helix transcriptional regulator [Planctomycetota bacterium]